MLETRETCGDLGAVDQIVIIVVGEDDYDNDDDEDGRNDIWRWKPGDGEWYWGELEAVGGSEYYC